MDILEKNPRFFYILESRFFYCLYDLLAERSEPIEGLTQDPFLVTWPRVALKATFFFPMNSINTTITFEKTDAEQNRLKNQKL